MPCSPTTKIHFTVSMWNRAEHLKQLLANLQLIVQVDKHSTLHVAFFDSDDITAAEARRRIEEEMDFPARMTRLSSPFNNGHGHNIAAGDCGAEDILCAVTVDLRMPLNICARIRTNVELGKKFYGPKTYSENEQGNLYADEYGYAMFGLFGQDFVDVGGFVENKKWGGDNDEQPEGGEDMVMVRRLKRAGLKEVRPYALDLVCRWHPRDITSGFYSSLRRYRKKPWWTFTNSKGETATFP